MIYKSDKRELLNYVKDADISNVYGIYKVQDGSDMAFVTLTDDGKYPEVYKVTNFDDNKLVAEICNILERYYVLPDKYACEDGETKGTMYDRKKINFHLPYVVIFSIIFLIAIFLSALYLKNFKITAGFVVIYVVYLFDTIWEVIKWYNN